MTTVVVKLNWNLRCNDESQAHNIFMITTNTFFQYFNDLANARMLPIEDVTIAKTKDYDAYIVGNFDVSSDAFIAFEEDMINYCNYLCSEEVIQQLVSDLGLLLGN